MNKFNPALRDELLYLRSEVSEKDEHIANLQDELGKLRIDFEKHTLNLKQHLLQKDEEIDNFAEKLNNSELTLKEQIKNLTSDKNRLEKELTEKMSASETDNESDWGSGWGDTNDTDVSTLREENESLCNEVSMKEIVLSSIETKMRQLSGGKHLDASEFSTWIDDFLEDAKKEQDRAANLSELVLYLKEEIDDNSSGEDVDLDSLYDWVSKGKEEKVALERKITKLENTIRSVEENIKSFDKKSQDFKISDLSDWLETFSSLKTAPQTEEKNSTSSRGSIGDEDEDKMLLITIQESVRDFDEDDAQFEIKNFQEWIEKVQNKIDDLEVELLQDQDLKDTEEEQRITERAKLKEMFDEKDREIGQLKVELYNRSQEGNYEKNNEIVGDNSNASHVQEQLNEAIARSEALQNELLSSRDNILTLELQLQQLTDQSKENSDLKSELKSIQNEKQALQDTYNLYNQTENEMTLQLQKQQDEVSKMQNNLDCVNSEMENLLSDVDAVHNFLNSICCDNKADLLEQRSNSTENLFKTTHGMM